MILLRSLQTGRTTTVRTSDEIDTTPFLRVAAELLLLFHEHWRRNNFTVMRELFSSSFLSKPELLTNLEISQNSRRFQKTSKERWRLGFVEV